MITPSGKPVPEIRTELRRIDDRRNVGSVLLTLAQPVATIGAAIWLDNPVAWVAAFLLMGPVHARFAILAHEAAHKLLFTDKRWNDLVGRWLLAYPALVPFDVYRRLALRPPPRGVRAERARHEPVRRHPVTRASFRQLRRDAVGISGWKNLRGALGVPQPDGTPRRPAHRGRPARRARASGADRSSRAVPVPGWRRG